MSEEETLRSMARWFYLLVLLAGMGFYITWSAMFDAWTDLGVYGISIVLISFGFFGTLLYWKKNED